MGNCKVYPVWYAEALQVEGGSADENRIRLYDSMKHRLAVDPSLSHIYFNDIMRLYRKVSWFLISYCNCDCNCTCNEIMFVFVFARVC